MSEDDRLCILRLGLLPSLVHTCVMNMCMLMLHFVQSPRQTTRAATHITIDPPHVISQSAHIADTLIIVMALCAVSHTTSSTVCPPVFSMISPIRGLAHPPRKLRNAAHILPPLEFRRVRSSSSMPSETSGVEPLLRGRVDRFSAISKIPDKVVLSVVDRFSRWYVFHLFMLRISRWGLRRSLDFLHRMPAVA